MSRDIIAYSDPIQVSGTTEERRSRMQRVVDTFTIKAEKALRSPDAGMPPRNEIVGVIKETVVDSEVDLEALLVLLTDIPKHFAAAEVSLLVVRAREHHAEGYFPVFYWFEGRLALFGSKAVQLSNTPAGQS